MLGRALIFVFVCAATIVCSFLFAPKAHAIGRYHVFDVRKNIQMRSNEAVVRDYYINAGTRDGLKQGMVVNIIRREPMHDLYSEIQDDLVIPVGRIKLIIVQRTLSIGRLISTRLLSEGPILEYSTVMTGDRVDLGSAKFDDEGEGSGGKDGSGAGDATGESAGAAKAPTPKKSARVKADEVSPGSDGTIREPETSSGPKPKPEPMMPAPQQGQLPPKAPEPVTAKAPKVKSNEPPQVQAPDQAPSDEGNSLYQDEDAIVLPQ